MLDAPTPIPRLVEWFEHAVTRRIPLEVKYQRRIDELRDTEGLRTFLEKAVNKAPFGILVTQVDGAVVRDPRIACVPLSSLMLLR